MYLIILFMIAGLIFGVLLAPSQLIYLWTLSCCASAAWIALRLLNLWLKRRRNSSPPIKISIAYGRICVVLVLLSFGSVWSAVWLSQQLEHRLPMSANGSDISLYGCIDQVLDRELVIRNGEPIVAKLKLLLQVAESPYSLRYVSLSWYYPKQKLSTGQCIQATVRLRSPRSFANGLPFDYEAYLLIQSIDASGYIKTIDTVLADEQYSPAIHRNLWIEQLANNIPSGAWPWIAGLVLGEKDAFSTEQWHLARNTGTLHLLVVSGLHVGLVAIIATLISNIILRFIVFVRGRSVGFAIWLPALTAIVVSGGYAWLAGFGVSLQRSWLMVVIAVLIFQFGYRARPLYPLSLALLLMLLANPLVITQVGFWFSFSAVSALVIFFSGRKTSWLEAATLPQWVVFCVCLPIALTFGQPVSLIHCLINLIAIPVLTLALLPLSLLALATRWDWAYSLLAQIGDWYWYGLALIEPEPSSAVWWLEPIPLVLWLIFLILLRLSGNFILVIGLFSVNVFMLLCGGRPEPDVLVMLDVGQGQSVYVTSRGKALVFDTGPAFSATFSAGDAILLPDLLRRGTSEISALVVSHSDLDHAGGLSGVLAGPIPIKTSYFGQPLAANLGEYAGEGDAPSQALSCHRDRYWRVYSTDLAMRFFPIPEEIRTSDNDASCVVQVVWHGQRLMISGDASQSVEKWLVKTYGNDLKSDVLIVGHHGSRTSTAELWLDAVRPKQAWISVGFQSRFGHPHQEVMERLAARGIDIIRTDERGRWQMNADGGGEGARDGWQFLWRQP
jgi:competence protein ComEC